MSLSDHLNQMFSEMSESEKAYYLPPNTIEVKAGERCPKCDTLLDLFDEEVGYCITCRNQDSEQAKFFKSHTKK